LSDKDYIKELFQNELGNHQMKVDPQLWQGVQSQLGSLASAGASGTAAVASKVSFFVKIGVAAVISTAAITTYVLVKNDTPSEKIEVSEEQAISESTEVVLEDNNSELHKIISDTDDFSAESPIITNAPPSNLLLDLARSPRETDSSPDLSLQTLIPTENPAPPSAASNEGSNSAAGSITSPDIEPPVSLVISIEFDKQTNQHYVFSAVSDDAERIVWDFGDGSTFSDSKAEHVYNESGTFTVTAYAYRKDEVVQETLSITVDVVGKITNLPTLFTPNNDGSNDEFFIESEGLLDFSVVIMNDKGEILFESNVPDFRWDGRNRKTGLVADEGVYFYIITAKDELGNTISKHQRLQLKK
jgi:gliding motility-associated-like protein